MAVAPRPGAGARADAEKASVSINVDGVTHTFYPAEVSARMASEVRAATGRSLRAVLESAEDDPDLDTIAVLVWLARRQAGERKLPFAVVADSLTYESSVEAAEAAPDDEVPDSPEA